MSEFRLPVPISELEEIIREYVKEKKTFTKGLATIDLMIWMDRGKEKPYRYYAKRWRWKETTTYDRLPVMRETVAEWRDLTSKTKPSTIRAESEHDPSKKRAKQAVNGVHPSTIRAESEHDPSSIKQTTNSNSGLNDKELKQTNPQKAARFKKPKIESVLEYLEKYTTEKKIICDISERAETFWDFYESKGWKVGKNPMKDWRAAVRNFLRSAKRENGNNRQRSIKRTYDGTNDPEFKQFYAT